MTQLQARLAAGHWLKRAGVWPGLLLALTLAVVAGYLAELIGVAGLGFAHSPVSPILLAILGGLALRNLFSVPLSCEAGVRFAQNHLLKLGIILLGMRLSLATIGGIGLDGAPVVLGCILTALVVVSLAGRWLGLTPTLGALIAVGTSICGCTAIMAAAPVLRADRAEVCYAVTCVALFGTAGMLLYPFLARLLFGDDPLAAGMLLGVGIHDTSQVVGAGLLYSQYFASDTALDAAIVTKLLRNLSIVAVIPLLAMLSARRQPRNGGARPSPWDSFPVFILGFLLLSLCRSIGDLGDRAFGVLEPAAWGALVSGVEQASTLLLTIAMAAVGLATNLHAVRGLGLRPAGVGLLAATVVGGVGAGLIAGLL